MAGVRHMPTKWASLFLFSLCLSFAPAGAAVKGPAKAGPMEEEPVAEEAVPAEGDDEEKEKEAELDAVIELELKYAEMLTNNGLPDYAKIVLGRLNPDAVGPRFKVIQLQGLIALGKFDEVKRVIAQEADQESAAAWAMKLALADGYYAWGKYKEARGLYDGFFRKYKDGPPKELNKFFRDSAYKCAQLLILMGDRAAAIEAYRATLKAQLKKHVKRQIMAETAELMLKDAEEAKPDVRKAIFREVEKLLDEVLYGASTDLWFGKAMTMMAHMKVMENDVEGAMFQVENSWEQIVQLDGALRHEEQKQCVNLTKHSPLAQCRYLLGEMKLKEAQKLFPIKNDGDKEKAFNLLANKDEKGKGGDGAYIHFMNVFYNYPSSTWAPDAMEKAGEARKLLEELGATIALTIPPEKLAEIEKAQFHEARVLLNQNQYKDAAEACFLALKMFPEGEPAVYAFADLATCHIEMNALENVSEDDRVMNDRCVDMIVRYVAERFNKNKALSVKAGDQLLRIAGKCEELKRADRKAVAYSAFFQSFARHPRAPEKLFEFGRQLFDAGNMDGALAYFAQIQTNYTGNRVFHPALSKIAQCYNKKEEFIQETKTLLALIESLKKETAPGQLLVASMYRLAYAYESLGSDYVRKGDDAKKEAGEKHLATAIKRFGDLIKILSDPAHPHNSQKPDDKENNQIMLQGSLYYTGMCYSMLTRPADKVGELKQMAIASHSRLAQEFPNSRFAPSALAQLGTLHTILEDANKAKEALKKLQKQYPESDEAKNSKFILAMNLLQLGMRDEAIRAFKDMFAAGGAQYNEMQILIAGLKLAEAKEHEIALQAFRKVVENAKKGATAHELAVLGQGKCATELNLGDEAVKALEAVKKDYPQSRSIVDAAFYLSRAYAEQAAKEQDREKRIKFFNEAVKNVNFARRYMKTAGEQAFAQLAIGKIFLSVVEAEEKWGDPQSVEAAIGKAIVPLWSLCTTGDLEDAKVRMRMEEAFHLAIPLHMKSKRWKDGWDRCNEYLESFASGGKYVDDVRKWRGEAQTKMVLEGISPDQSPKTPTGKPVATPETGAEGPGAAAPTATNAPAAEPAKIDGKPAEPKPDATARALAQPALAKPAEENKP
ncbi:MAG: tetratricopeptide repeat protein [Verrucomicrobiota bacterium]|nr:tetratricopeptide repeat protein [Verrucomicrobiota bacterium]